MKLFGNFFLLVISATTAYMVIRALLDGIREHKQAHSAGLNDDLRLTDAEDRIAGRR